MSKPWIVLFLHRGKCSRIFYPGKYSGEFQTVYRQISVKYWYLAIFDKINAVLIANYRYQTKPLKKDRFFYR